jgi:hypothetical protein
MAPLEPSLPDKPSSKEPKPSSKEPEHSAPTRAGKAARAARVANEMRLNLLKRKAQQRARRAKDAPA